MSQQNENRFAVAEGDQHAKQRGSLLKEIRSRKKFDNGCAELSFWTYQAQGWLLVCASFVSAIGAASEIPKLTVAILAAIPGAIFVLDQRLNFARRAQWHWIMQTRLLELEHELLYQGAKTDDVSKRYVELRKEMEMKYPIVPEDWSERAKARPRESPQKASPPSDHSKQSKG